MSGPQRPTLARRLGRMARASLVYACLFVIIFCALDMLRAAAKLLVTQ